MRLQDAVSFCHPRGADPAPHKGDETWLECTVKATAASQDHPRKICSTFNQGNVFLKGPVSKSLTLGQSEIYPNINSCS